MWQRLRPTSWEETLDRGSGFRRLELHVQDNWIVKVTSPLDHDVGHGHLCVKGRFGFELVQRRAGES